MRTRSAFLVVLLWASPALAYRPFDGTDADVAETGEAELEMGPLGYYRLGQTSFLTLPGVVLNYGAFHRVEFVLQTFNFVQLGPLTGSPRDVLTDTAFNVKAVLREGCLQEKPGVSIATEIGALLPNINGETGFGGSLAGILSQCLDAVTLHYNAEVSYNLEQEIELFGSIIAEGPHRWVVRPVAEVYVDSQIPVGAAVPEQIGPSEIGNTTYSVLLGAIWRAAEKLDFDAAMRVASAAGLANFEVRLGFSWAFR